MGEWTTSRCQYILLHFNSKKGKELLTYLLAKDDMEEEEPRLQNFSRFPTMWTTWALQSSSTALNSQYMTASGFRKLSWRLSARLSSQQLMQNWKLNTCLHLSLYFKTSICYNTSIFILIQCLFRVILTLWILEWSKSHNYKNIPARITTDFLGLEREYFTG